MLQTLLNGVALGFIASPTCPSNAEEIRVGTLAGFGGAALVALGAVTGDAAVLVVVLAGLHPLMEAYPPLRALLWLVGAVVLGYIAIGIFREVRHTRGLAEVAASGPQRVRSPASPAPLRAFWAGFAITTFNPFTVVWWVGLLAPALERGDGLPVAFAAAVLAGALVWFLGLAAVLHLARGRLTTRVRRGILIVSGLAVSAYAVYFAWRGVLVVPEVL